MRWLFYKEVFDWPPRTGGTVHTGNLMKALVREGMNVTFASADSIDPEASGWLEGVNVITLPESVQGPGQSLGGFKGKLASYYGVTAKKLSQFDGMVRQISPDYVVSVGLETLPLLSSLTNPRVRKIWYPADDPVLLQLTLMRESGFSLARIRKVVTALAYERAFRSTPDVTWVVSQRDRNWLSRAGGLRNVAIVPNGVDSSYFSPVGSSIRSNACVFWGRLDFQPNVDAIRFFLDLWPTVVSRIPSAKFVVCGAHPTLEIRTALQECQGVEFFENPDDLRPIISSVPVAVFPMVSGGGVKNKVLEAAAMARKILVTPTCLNGLHCDPAPPFEVINEQDHWVASLINAWQDPLSHSGEKARDWVISYHSWDQTAQAALRSIECCLSEQDE